MDFTPELALALCNSEEEFPVDFDDAWQWIGYSEQNEALEKFSYLSLNLDYDLEILECHPFAVLMGPSLCPLDIIKNSVKSRVVEILTQKTSNRFRLRSAVERDLSRKIARKLNGETEVRVPSGFIDVLTSDRVIEVKLANWKHGIGQVLAYASHYHGRTPCLVIPSLPSDSSALLDCCAQYGVELLTLKDLQITISSSFEEKISTSKPVLEDVKKWAIKFKISLSVEGLACLAALSGTSKGKEVWSVITRMRESFRLKYVKILASKP